METNPVQQAASTQPVQQPQVQQAQQAGSNPPPMTTKSNAKGMLIIALTVVIVVLLIGVVWYTFSQSQPVSSTDTVAPIAKQATPAASLEDEVNAVNIESNDKDFADVDSDLQSL